MAACTASQEHHPRGFGEGPLFIPIRARATSPRSEVVFEHLAKREQGDNRYRRRPSRLGEELRAVAGDRRDLAKGCPGIDITTEGQARGGASEGLIVNKRSSRNESRPSTRSSTSKLIGWGNYRPSESQARVKRESSESRCCRLPSWLAPGEGLHRV